MNVGERLAVVETKILGMNRLLWVLLASTFGLKGIEIFI